VPRTGSNCALSRLGRGEDGENQRLLKEGGILGTAPPTVTVQITPKSSPAIPTWMGEVAAFAHVLTHTGMLKTIQEQVCFARARFGSYDLVDFVAVLIGSIHAARTNEAFLLRTARSVGGYLYGARCRETACPIAQPCPGFWRLSTNPRWKPYAHAFKRICLPASRFLPLVVYSTGEVRSGW
jgi:hypothetical protein